MSKMYDVLMNYNVENLVLLKKGLYNVVSTDGFNTAITRDMTQQQKLAILDKFTANRASEVYNILSLLQVESSKFKLLPGGYRYNVNSIRAFFRAHDKKGYFTERGSNKTKYYYKIPYNFLPSSTACILVDITVSPQTSEFREGMGYLVLGYGEYGHTLKFTGKPIVDYWFNCLMADLFALEKKHHASIDPLELKYAKVKQLVKNYGTFENARLNDIGYNARPNGITESELDIYLECFSKLVSLEKSIVNKLKEDKRLPR